VAIAAVLVVVVVIVVGILISRGGNKTSQADVRNDLAAVMTGASQTAGPGGQPLDLVRLRKDLENASSGWLIDLAATDDRRTVGVAARQPDGPNCILLWTAVGGARSVAVDDPILPGVGRVALAAAT
jgi:hypothetical protein